MYRVRMPTPGERRALIFIAAIAALGVALRGWKEVRGPDVAAGAGDPDALARQIEAADWAIAAGAGPGRGRPGGCRRGARRAGDFPGSGRRRHPPVARLRPRRDRARDVRRSTIATRR